MNLKNISLVFLALFIVISGPHVHAGEYERAHISRVDVDGHEHFGWDEISIEKADEERLYFDVEMAMTVPQQMQGLMYRTEMPDHTGMLFVFDNVSMRSFWMKNTLIPLDMLFLAPDGQIHHIHHNAKPQDLTGITSKYPSKAVLEIGGGLANQFGIKEGDVVLHDLFNNVGVER